MALPWLRILDLALTFADMARKTTRRQLAAGEPDTTLATAAAPAATEARLAGVVVAALKEAFNRDNQRLEFERERVDAERRRAERLLKIELARQAGDREIGRLRLIGAIAIGILLTTIVAAAVSGGGGTATRIGLAGAWLCLLGAAAAAFMGQTAVSTALAALGDPVVEVRPPASGTAGSVAAWLVLAGLAVLGGAVLFS
ncbi:MAG: hypothetical protein AB7O32_15980 [Vicinamibacterales bacterium]